MSAPVQVGPSPQGGGPVPSLDVVDILADIGDRVRAERQARGWNQVELARRSGAPTSAVKRVEAGPLGVWHLVAVCAGLGMSLGQLLSDEWELPRAPVSLTSRQAEVLGAVADGRSLSVAAVGLGMTSEGVASALTVIYRRLAVSHLPRGERRAAAVRVAMQNDLLDVGNRTS